jgi:hypothetical protein
MRASSNPFRAREREEAHGAHSPSFSTLPSVKCSNSAQHGADAKWLKHLVSATARKVVKNRAKPFLELQISCSTS